MKRVLFYDDVPIFGGHQVTAVAAARHLAANGVEVISAIPSANDRLRRAWSTLDNAVRIIPIDVQLTRWQPFLSPFGIAARPVRELIRDVAPDAVIAVQGTIVQSNRAVEQSRRLGIPAISFVPMGVHFAPELWVQAWIARPLARFHYTRPDGFLTISENSRRELLEGGARGPIRVVYCGADLTRLKRTPHPPSAPSPRQRGEGRSEQARSKSLLPAGGEKVPEGRMRGHTLAIVGRVSFGTKGHDVLLRALTRIPDAQLLIVGDGPDDAHVDAMINDLGLAGRVRRIPWQDDMSAIYSSVDMVVIPSRFEGLPLVALEAMFFELPIAAADMGAMREVLPESWLFPVGDDVACAATIERLRRADVREVLAANRERVVRELNEEAYGTRFHAALQDLYDTIRRSRR